MNNTLVKKSYLDMDAGELANLIVKEEATIVEIVQTFINHIKNVDKILNAVVEERFSAALLEAEQMDKQLHSQFEKGPLYGVPISIKESFHVKDMKTTGGLLSKRDFIATEDADIVSKLKDAGAIILCKTNTPTLCYCQETDNKLYGRTNNSWDISRTAGGSSGGEGALLSVGGTAVGIGSDIGGSIRFPSHFNGVVGFKAGKYQISSNGHFPADHIPIQTRMSSMGPMGKSVRDIELIYKIIAEIPHTPKSLANIQIDFLPKDIHYPLSKQTSKLLDQIENFLSKRYETNRSVPPFFTDSAQLWQEIMSVHGGKLMSELAFDKKHPNLITTYIKEKLTNKTDIHPYLTWALIGSKLFKPSQNRIERIEEIIKHGDEKIDHYLQHRLLIFPVYHTAAPKHGKVYQEIFSIRKTFRKYMPYVAYANVWGLPSLIVPVGTDEDDLPISIQIMSINGNEDLIFQLGKVLETEFRGYVRNTKLD